MKTKYYDPRTKDYLEQTRKSLNLPFSPTPKNKQVENLLNALEWAFTHLSQIEDIPRNVEIIEGRAQIRNLIRRSRERLDKLGRTLFRKGLVDTIDMVIHRDLSTSIPFYRDPYLEGILDKLEKE